MMHQARLCNVGQAVFCNASLAQHATGKTQKEALHFKLKDENIADVSALDLQDLYVV